MLVWAGVLRPGPASAFLLLLAWIPLLSGPTEQGEAAEERLHLTNTAALTPCQDGGTQPSHTKKRKTGAQAAPKAEGTTSEGFLRFSKHWQGFLLKCTEKKMELNPKNGRTLF